MLVEMLDANEDGEVDSFEWTTMLSQVHLKGMPIFCLTPHLCRILLSGLTA